MTTPFPHCPWPAEATLADGRSLRLRALRPDDRPALARSLARLSPDARSLHFGTAEPPLNRVLLDDLSTLDDDTHVAWGAFDGIDLVGVFHYRRHKEATAVASLSGYVLDAYRRQGLARRLVTTLGGVAQHRHLVDFAIEVYPTNRIVRAWVQRQGIRLHERDGLLHGRLSLARCE